MNSFINLMTRSLAVMNERMKEMNTATRIGSLFRDILTYTKKLTDDLHALVATKADKSVVDALVNGIIKQPSVDTYKIGSNSLSAIYGLTSGNNGSNEKVKQNGWDVLVRQDETKGGKSNRYNWNGTQWVDMEIGVYDENIASQQDITRLNNIIDIKGLQLPSDGIVTYGGGLTAANNNFIFDANRNGWVMLLPTGTKYDGQHLYAFRNVPIWYDKDLPHELTINMLVKYKHPQTAFPFSHSIQFSNRVGSSVKQQPFSSVQTNIVGNDLEGDTIMLSLTINLDDIVNVENSGIDNKSYILVSAYFQFPVKTDTATEDLEVWIDNRSMYISGFSNRNLNTYVENKVLIKGKGMPMPFSCINTTYPEDDPGTSVAHVGKNGGTIQAGWSSRLFTFDLSIQIARFLNDFVGQAFFVRVRYTTDNLNVGSSIAQRIDSYFVNENFSSGKMTMVYWLPNEKEILFRCVTSSKDFIRMMIPTTFLLDDSSKDGTAKISDVSLIYDVPDLLTQFYDNWDFAKSLNDGNPITALSEWQQKTSCFPIKLSAYAGEQFYGAEMNNRIGRLFIPRRIKQLNPNYIAATFNKEVWQGLVKDISGQSYIQKKVMLFSWFVKYRYLGHGLNGKDDNYYNSSSFVTANNVTGNASANPGGISLLSAKRTYFPTKESMNGDPYFIVRYEYHIDMNKDTNTYGKLGCPTIYAMLQNNANVAGLDIEAQSLGCYVRQLDMPLFDDTLGRALKYAAAIDEYATIPLQIGLASGQRKRYATDTYGAILEGDSGTANKQTAAFTGYYGLNKPAVHNGSVVAMNINSSVSQVVDLVIGLIDQNGIIIPGVVVENVNLVAGSNVIGYYNSGSSPLPVKVGEQLFVRQKTANAIPYMDNADSGYVIATDINSPVTEVVSGKQLDFRYIVDYVLPPAYEIPSKEEHLELKGRVSDVEQMILTGIPVYSPNGSKFFVRVTDAGELIAGRNIFHKLLIIGNSITWHSVNSYWWGTWGMAATVKEKDYANLIWAQAKKGDPNATLDCFNFAAWEQATTSANRQALLSEHLDTHLALNPDGIVIRLCENVQPAGTPTLRQDYQTMLQYIKNKAPNAKIFCGGSFWKADDKDARIKSACDAEGVSFSKQSHLDTTENRSAIGTQVYGDDGQWHTVNNAGVAGHPGDKGMEAIAKVFIEQMDI